MGEHKHHQACAVHHCRHSHWKFWALAGAVCWIYHTGKQQRPAQRQPLMKPLDETTVAETLSRVTHLPQFRYMRRMVMQRALEGRRRANVLDIGCGVGQLALQMAQRSEVARVIGVDLSADLLAQARQSSEEMGVANTEFLQLDAAEMPFPDGEFDIVVSTISLHHWSDPERVLREIKRVLKPTGRALIFDLRRDASPFIWGMATLISRYLAPQPIRDTGEPLVSLQSAYTAAEVALLAYKAGWPDPRVTQGPVWLLLELDNLSAE